MNRKLTFAYTLFVSLFVAGAYPTGFIPMSEKARLRYSEICREYPIAEATRGSLPSSHANTEHLPVVNSQGSLGICGSYCVSYYLWNYYESKRLGEGRWSPAKDGNKMSSPMWAVLMVSHGYTDSGPFGADYGETMMEFCSRGYMTWNEMPYTGSLNGTTNLPSAAQQLKAMKNARKHSYILEIKDIHTEEGLMRLKQALVAGDIFVCSIQRITQNFNSYPDLPDNMKEQCNNNGVFAWKSDDGTLPGHALTIIGYDDNKAYTNQNGKTVRGALLAVNSWGTSWGVQYNGESGYIWIGYECLQQSGLFDGNASTLKLCDATGYVPERTAIVTVSGDSLKQSIAGSTRFWPGGMSFELNGQSLSNPIQSMTYLNGLKGNENCVEYLLDLTGYEDNALYELETSFTTYGSAVVGLLNNVKVLGANGKELNSFVLNSKITEYSHSYPVFTCKTSSLNDTSTGLPDIHPHTGSIAFGDLNGDGITDMVYSIRQYTQGGDSWEFRHEVCLAKQNGTYSKSILSMNNFPADVILVDLNNDGILDLAASDGKNTFFFQNDGNGKFTELAKLDHGDAWGVPGHFLCADFNHDGRPDFVLKNNLQTMIICQSSSATNYSIYPICSAKLSTSTRQDIGMGGAGLAVGDINGDGWTDIVSADGTSLLLINNGDMSFDAYELPFPKQICSSISTADVNQDGCDDILFSGSSFSETSADETMMVFAGRPNAKGKVQIPLPMPISSDAVPRWGGNVAWADLDMDGRVEAIVTGTEGKPSGTYPSDSYGENDVKKFPLHEIGRTYLSVLKWNGSKFVDAGIKLPGTAGTCGPSLLTLFDIDGDGRMDIFHGGAFYTRSISIAGPSWNTSGMKYLKNAVTKTNKKPSAPSNLAAKALGNGKVQFTWSAGKDTETAADGLRYILRIGTANGKGDILQGSNSFAVKSGAIMTCLPNKKLYCAARTLDATGNMSDWSSEITITPTGTGKLPSPSAEFPEIIPLQSIKLTVSNADETFGRAFAYEYDSNVPGLTAKLMTYAWTGYRFAFWEGGANEPLNRQSTATIYENSEITAHIIADNSVLQTSPVNTAYKDANGNLWIYDTVQKTIAEKKKPMFSSSSDVANFKLSPDGNFTLLDEPEIGTSIDMGGFQAVLTSKGIVKCKGSNARGQLGRATPESFSQYAEVEGLPLIFSIAAGRCFVAALDFNGNIWTWGDNEYGQLGRTPSGGFLPVPAKIAGLSAKIVAIAAGDTHLIALDEKGKLHAWGNNDMGQLGKSGTKMPLADKTVALIAAAGTHTCALDTSGLLYMWGDGTLTPKAVDTVGFETVSCNFDSDDRASALLPVQSGSYQCRKGVELTFEAKSNEGSIFSHWLLNDNKSTANPLVLTPTAEFTLKAVYEFSSATISLCEPYFSGNEIIIPLSIANADTKYDGIDFTISFTKGFTFDQLMYNTSLSPDANFWTPIFYTSRQFDDEETEEGLVTRRFFVHHIASYDWIYCLNGNETRFLGLSFKMPYNIPSASVKLIRPPVIARSDGAYSETTVIGRANISLSFDENERDKDDPDLMSMYKCVGLSKKGLKVLKLPGSSTVSTIEELQAYLGVTNLTAWHWNGKVYTGAEQIEPHKVLLVDFNGTPATVDIPIVAETETLSLDNGWNLVAVSDETVIPQYADVVIRLDSYGYHSVSRHDMLYPGEVYWIFRKR